MGAAQDRRYALYLGRGQRLACDPEYRERSERRPHTARTNLALVAWLPPSEDRA